MKIEKCLHNLKSTEIKAIVKGVLSLVPGINAIGRREGGGANSARYCYSVWLRHLVIARSNGMTTIPKTLAEVGPGDSLGIGIAALLSGVESYAAFDVVNFIRLKQNLDILEELCVLFRDRTPIPGDEEFPLLSPKMESYSFPFELIPDHVLKKSLSVDNIKEIREALIDLSNGKVRNNRILYFAPWTSNDVLKESSIDFIVSQAVLEHVDDLPNTYQTMNRWLKNGGYCSHQIDFKSHGYANEWYGHWCYSDLKWFIIKGKRPYLLNRETLSTHLHIHSEYGFEILTVLRQRSTTPAKREKLAKKYVDIPDDDLITSSAYVLSVKSNEVDF
jgi:hypothetical protein